MLYNGFGDGPLTGLRVIELGHALAGPFACTLLADLGAEVIKLEQVGEGDDVRRTGLMENGVSLWWAVTGRNKKSVCIDVKKPEGLDVLKSLIRVSDVLVENFRPGVLERMGLGWPDLTELNDQLVLLRVSGFGQTGPYSYRRGFGKIAEAFCGATNLTGYADAAPVHPGYSLADAVTGLMGAFGVVAAIRSRDGGAGGQVIDLALYEGLLRMIEWQLPYVGRLEFNSSRNGGEFPFTGAYLTGIWPSRDDHFIVISAATSQVKLRILRLLQSHDAWPTTAGSDDIDDIPALAAGVRTWIAATDAQTVLQELEDAGAVAGMVYDPATIVADPHMRERGSVIDIGHPQVTGSIPMPGVFPLFDKTPGRVREPAPILGYHTEEILGDLLGYSAESIAALIDGGVAQGARLADQLSS
jgi:crotonobetainyl-CoA:carnitine CoA-transferase CaiB-like acyl-CoA transferase